MIEESFVRLYAHEFVQLAWRNEIGQATQEALRRRMDELRRHSDLMKTRKGADHLAAVISRLRDEADRYNPRMVQKGVDPMEAGKRHRIFLMDVADRLSEAPVIDANSIALPAIRRRR